MIEREDLDRLDEIFVRKDQCVILRSQMDKRIDETEKAFAVMNTKLSILIGILGAIAVPILGIAIKMIFGG